jgi:hypothetical protein
MLTETVENAGPLFAKLFSGTRCPVVSTFATSADAGLCGPDDRGTCDADGIAAAAEDDSDDEDGDDVATVSSGSTDEGDDDGDAEAEADAETDYLSPDTSTLPAQFEGTEYRTYTIHICMFQVRRELAKPFVQYLLERDADTGALAPPRVAFFHTRAPDRLPAAEGGEDADPAAQRRVAFINACAGTIIDMFPNSAFYASYAKQLRAVVPAADGDIYAFFDCTFDKEFTVLPENMRWVLIDDILKGGRWDWVDNGDDDEHDQDAISPVFSGMFGSTPDLAGPNERPVTLYICDETDGEFTIPYVIDPAEGRTHRFTREPAGGGDGCRRVAAFERDITESSDGQYVHIKSADAFADL